MIELVVIGVVAGVLAGVSPCVLPVLPVILVAGASPAGSPAGEGEDATAMPPARRGRVARPLSVVSGLVLSFSLLVLAGSEVLSLLHLPQDSLRDAGIALLALVGIGYLVPAIGSLIERPFARLGLRQPSGRLGGFVLGLILGVLFVPCAGPVLAAITVVGATHRVGLTAVILTAAFATGSAIPLFAVASAGGQLSSRVGALRRRGPLLRRFGGVVLVAMALVVGFNLFGGLQRDVPGYSDALQGSANVRRELNTLTGAAATPLSKCDANATGLVDCGPAPNFRGITAWLNTPGGRPLSIRELKGKVVLVDFWTYSCINCQRSLPHVEAWYRRYARDGFVVVGVHTPEFAFEHVVSNVRAEAAALGVHYPVAVDDDDATWNAYDNEYWPADYLIDAQGIVRHVHFGEGDYAGTEQLIRQLLVQAHPHLALPPPTEVANLTPTGELSPETYVGYDRVQYLYPDDDVEQDKPAHYSFPSELPLGAFALSGTWDDHAQEATAGPGAELELGFLAKDVYLVLGGRGTLQVSVDGRHRQTIRVGGIPRLYTLVRSRSTSSGTVLLRASSGIEAYDFTFG